MVCTYTYEIRLSTAAWLPGVQYSNWLWVCVLQAANKNVAKVPPPVPTKPKQINLPYFGQAGPPPSDVKPDGNPPQLPAAVTPVGPKPKPAGQQPRVVPSPSVPSGGHDQGLSTGPKQESPPAAAVRPFTPQPPKDAVLPAFRKPQTVAASSIYSMYTQHQALGKNFQQAVQSALTKTQPRGPHFASGKALGRGRARAARWWGQQSTWPSWADTPVLGFNSGSSC